MKTIIHNDWQTVLAPEFEKPYYGQLHAFLKEEYQTTTVYPEMHHIFQAFEWTPFKDVKVVILGKILIMARIKRTVAVFRFYRALKCRRHYAIFIKN